MRRDRQKSVDNKASAVDVPGVFLKASREHQPDNSIIHCGPIAVGGAQPVVIAGPCSVESREEILEIARQVKSSGAQMLRGGAFKPRTSPYSFQGHGEKALEWLKEAGQETGLPVVTEVMDARDIRLVGGCADLLQIGSRNMQNYSLLRAVGRQSLPVLLKRGMSATLDEFLNCAEYILAEGNMNVILCERGIRTFSDFTRNTLDLNIVPAIRERSHLPVIVDPSHGTGNRGFVAPMCMASLAAGAHGLMIEVHTNPDQSVSDGAQTISTQDFARLMRKINHFSEWQRADANASIAH